MQHPLQVITAPAVIMIRELHQPITKGRPPEDFRTELCRKSEDRSGEESCHLEVLSGNFISPCTPHFWPRFWDRDDSRHHYGIRGGQTDEQR
jgi:hypothetical protein